MICVIWTTAVPPSRRRRTIRAKASRARGSSIAVASSKTTRPGANARRPATATRCFCPPESESTSRAESSGIPASTSASFTTRSIRSRAIPRFSGPNATSSRTTGATIWLSGSWKETPARRPPTTTAAPTPTSAAPSPAAEPATAAPATPAPGPAPPPATSPASCNAQDVFPLPLAPTNATSSPGAIAPSREQSTTGRPFSPPAPARLESAASPTAPVMPPVTQAATASTGRFTKTEGACSTSAATASWPALCRIAATMLTGTRPTPGTAAIAAMPAKASAVPPRL